MYASWGGLWGHMRFWHSELARDLSKWAEEEKNRIKASKIMMVAERVEHRYVKSFEKITNVRLEKLH